MNPSELKAMFLPNVLAPTSTDVEALIHKRQKKIWARDFLVENVSSSHYYFQSFFCFSVCLFQQVTSIKEKLAKEAVEAKKPVIMGMIAEAETNLGNTCSRANNR